MPSLATPPANRPQYMSEPGMHDEASATAAYGRDAVEIYRLLSTPLRHPSFWNIRGVEGADRFLKALQKLAAQPLAEADSETPMQQHHFNTLLNHFYQQEVGSKEALHAVMQLAKSLASYALPPSSQVANLLQLAAPFAPETVTDLWGNLANTHPAACVQGLDALPVVDRAALVSPELELAVLVNGIPRDRIKITRNLCVEDIIFNALTPPVQASMGCRPARQIVLLPRRMVNFLTV